MELTARSNALAESVVGLYKTELVYRRGPWRGLDDLELGTLEWIYWYNHRRLHGACHDVPPAEFETITALLADLYGARIVNTNISTTSGSILSPSEDPSYTRVPPNDPVPANE